MPEVRDVELRGLGPRDVRVKIAAAGVCHSDLSMFNGTLAPQFPLVLGHEAAGTVAEVGGAVEGLEPGDRVVLNWAPSCQSCWFCRHDEPWLCSATEGVISTPFGRLADQADVYGCLGVGAFAEEIVQPANAVIPLPDGVPLDVAALLGCAVLTGVGAVRNTAGVRLGDSVLVLGLGGVGLATLAAARLVGAAPIIAADVVPEKEELAREAGATHFLVSESKLARQVRGLTEGRGVDHAFECVGTSATIRLAWQSARRGGKCTVVGVGGRDDEVRFNPLELHHFARTLTSSVYGSTNPQRDIPMLAEQVEFGRLQVASLITHRIGLDDVADAFDRMRSGHGARSLIELDK
ncbi:MAG: alcohol dehydrogenase catalytic domain-containing protein [Propionibacteriales bacterium]|nr:alcohol dehydrogenase catalytic domain-containing protein [Propionibacteriales bacterium]